MTPRRTFAAGAGIACLVSMSLACGEETERDATSFCAEIDSAKQQLTSPRLRTQEDVEAYVDLYRSIGEIAPLAIESEWSDLTSNYETAATVDPEDPESIEQAKAKAFSTEESATIVAKWLRSNCGVRLGPVSTIVPHDNRTAPSPTSTTTTP